MSNIPRTLLLVLLAACCGSSGCTAVAPWQRGILARPGMALDPAPGLQSLRGHTHESREATGGTEHAEGGGCGCT